MRKEIRLRNKVRAEKRAKKLLKEQARDMRRAERLSVSSNN